MAKKKTTLPTVTRSDDVQRDIIRIVDGREISLERVYQVPERHPVGLGPWLDEAEKVAWTDADTGLGCIVRRAEAGYLEGFVGVDGDHALHGWDHQALASSFGVLAHGGLDYSRPCGRGPEATSVCHPEGGTRGGFRVHDAPRDGRWWFGFGANQPYDLVPPARGARASHGTRVPVDDALTRPQVYRDMDYMIRECTALAAQIDAIAKGRPMPVRPAPPPIGLDPRKSGDS